MCVCIYACVCMGVYGCMCIYVCLCVMRVRAYVCLSLSLCVCVCVCMCVYVCICVCWGGWRIRVRGLPLAPPTLSIYEAGMRLPAPIASSPAPELLAAQKQLICAWVYGCMVHGCMGVWIRVCVCICGEQKRCMRPLQPLPPHTGVGVTINEGSG